MANSNGPAIYIYFLQVEAEFMNTGNGLGCKSFIQLDEVNITNGKACTLQCFLSSRYRTNAHDRRIHSRNGHTLYGSHRFKLIFCNHAVIYKQKHGGSIVYT